MNRKNITLTDLENDPIFSEIIKDLTIRMGGTLPDEVIDTLIDITSMADIVPQQIAQWVRDTSNVINRISGDVHNSSDVSVLYIRIFEIVDSLPRYFSKYLELHANINKYSNDPEMKKNIEAGEEIRKLLDQLVKSFTEDELTLLEYERNCNSHIFQNGYRVQVKVNDEGGLKSSKTHYKGKTINEVNTTITNELNKYRGKDFLFLKAILEKVKPILEAIYIKMDTWSPA